MDNTARICPMRERRYEDVPVDQVKVLNSRNREKDQFEMNVGSIDHVGLLDGTRSELSTLSRNGMRRARR
jgi:ParB family chromosome partitioning protein